MPLVTPDSAEQLAQILADAAAHSQTVALRGNGSKRLMAGPVLPADLEVSTSALRRVLHYERDDLTVSVESGLPWAELQRMLAANRQMVALDPPFAAQSTVGGVIAGNLSGPMRLRFGTARDLVIGMNFATLEGRCVRTGGMVVKNVAGLDMSKLMIGSFGTLAAIASINFRLHSLPPSTKTFLFTYPDLRSALARREAITKSVLQPLAMDLLSPAAAVRFDLRGYVLAIQAGGSASVLARYGRELTGGEQLTEDVETRFWQQVRDFTPEFLRRQPSGIVLRISAALRGLEQLLPLVSGASISRAGSGVTYFYLTTWQSVAPLWAAAAEHGWSAVVEFAPDEIRLGNTLWLQRDRPAGAGGFAIMKEIKRMFDPAAQLNRLRLYGQL